MSANRFSVLVVDDDPTICEVLTARLEDWGYEVVAAANGEQAERAVHRHDPDMVVADIVLPDVSGIDLLKRVKSGDGRRPVILMTAHGSIDQAVQAMKEGAEDFLTKPLDTDKLRSLLEAAGAELRLRSRIRELESRLDTKPGLGLLVGGSAAMQEVFRAVKLLAENEASAIIAGDSGTGKELVARTIHQLGKRRDGPLVAVNCAAIPEGLVESGLFGHVKGAFTGATQDRKGCFELADGGILFLDEIGEMPMQLQPRLLRILEEGRARRVGGARDIPFDVRVMAATNRDPQRAIEDGRLREDLYYRLAVFEVRLPALRERMEDIPLLAQHFVREFNAKHGTSVEGLRDETEALLAAYNWPGNVRELRNVMERAVIVANSGLLEPSRLPAYFQGREMQVQEASGRALVLPLGTTAHEAEKRLILKTLEHVGQNKTEAARQLGVDVKTIYNKLKRYAEEEAE